MCSSLLTLAELDVECSADSVEFCPFSGYSDLLVCGTYELQTSTPCTSATNVIPEEQGSKRLGRCVLYKWSEEDLKLLQVYRLEQPAVLDMKWSRCLPRSGPILAVADAEGHVVIRKWLKSEQRLELIQSIECAEASVLCLSLDWSDRRRSVESSPGSIVVSMSDGNLCLLSAHNSSMVVSSYWHAHDYEPWVAAWNYWDECTVYSGGDDCKLKAWDIRRNPSQPIFVNKGFDAGVTSIQNHPFVEHLISVGSYDNTVRLFDVRQPQMPITSVNAGGGAWRVKWHHNPERAQDLLVACMHDGFKIVRFGPCEIRGPGTVETQGLDQFGCATTIKRYDAHKSLAYGADWSYKDTSDGGCYIASCSFYDHSLHVWAA